MKKRKNTTVVRPVQPRLFDNKKLAALLIPLALDQLLNSFMGTVDTLVVTDHCRSLSCAEQTHS